MNKTDTMRDTNSAYVASGNINNEYFREMELHSGKLLADAETRAALETILKDIQHDITSILDRCGFYYRISARVKSRGSLDKKLAARDEDRNWIYHDAHHLQDLFGFRILLYFIEDMPIIKRLLNRHFQPEDTWTKRNYRENEFTAISVNGVFRIENEKTLRQSRGVSE